MDIQVNMEKVLEITQERLSVASRETILLQAVVQEQGEQILQLQKALERANESTLDKEEGNAEG